MNGRNNQRLAYCSSRCSRSFHNIVVAGAYVSIIVLTCFDRTIVGAFIVNQQRYGSSVSTKGAARRTMVEGPRSLSSFPLLGIFPSPSRLYESNDKNENDDDDQGGGVIDRFLNPIIDDPALPLTEAGIAQIVAPTLQLLWLRLYSSPDPSWARPLYDYTFTPRGALLAPTLIHGAGLACCWLAGCVAAQAYKKSAYEGTTVQVISSTLRAGAFACGLLVFATQYDLYGDFGNTYVQWGDSPETDLRIYRALVEVINDIFFEFVVLLSWRIVRSKVGPWVDGMQ